MRKDALKELINIVKEPKETPDTHPPQKKRYPIVFYNDSNGGAIYIEESEEEPKNSIIFQKDAIEKSVCLELGVHSKKKTASWAYHNVYYNILFFQIRESKKFGEHCKTHKIPILTKHSGYKKELINDLTEKFINELTTYTEKEKPRWFYMLISMYNQKKEQLYK